MQRNSSLSCSEHIELSVWEREWEKTQEMDDLFESLAHPSLSLSLGVNMVLMNADPTAIYVMMESEWEVMERCSVKQFCTVCEGWTADTVTEEEKRDKYEIIS